MNILWEINKLLPVEWYLENLSRISEGEWQALIGDGLDVYRGTGDSIEEAIGNAVVSSPIGTVFATSYAGDRPEPAKINVMAIMANRLPKLRRLR